MSAASTAIAYVAVALGGGAIGTIVTKLFDYLLGRDSAAVRAATEALSMVIQSAASVHAENEELRSRVVELERTRRDNAIRIDELERQYREVLMRLAEAAVGDLHGDVQRLGGSR